MIRKIIKMQCVKLFDSAEYVGFNLVGSFIVIVFGWGVLSMGENVADWQDKFHLSIARSFPALLVLCVCMSVYTFAREYENKTINYEVTYGAAIHKIIIGRMLAPVINTIIFTLVILGIEVILQYVGGCHVREHSAGFSGEIFLNFICVLHLNSIIGLYLVGTGSVAVSCVLIVLTQWCFPIGLEKLSILLEADEKLLSNLFCVDQFRSLWENDICETFVYKVLGSFVIETIVIFIIVCMWSYRRDWK